MVSGVQALAQSLPDGKKSIHLVTKAGESLRIGDVTFSGTGDKRSFAVDLNAEQFVDQFLSMRPFRCLESPDEMWCHLAYPYEIANEISANDLVPLEYALLWLFKPAQKYGIDTSNGAYFKFALGADGALVGELHELSMEPLGVPPDDPNVRPIRHADLSEGDVDARRFVRVEIR